MQTQNKLQDIKAAAEQIGVHGLSVVHNCITTGESGPSPALPVCCTIFCGPVPLTSNPSGKCCCCWLTASTLIPCPLIHLSHVFILLVPLSCSLPLPLLQPTTQLSEACAEPCFARPAVGQFKELVESSETDQPLQETLKKVLNFTSNGWHKAREHAMRAVSTDNRMRAWCADDSLEDGLLFKCYLGRVDLEAPVGKSKHSITQSCRCTTFKAADALLTKLQMQHFKSCKRDTSPMVLHSWAAHVLCLVSCARSHLQRLVLAACT